MRTARVLTISPSMPCARGGSAPGGVSALGGRVSAPGGVYLVQGGLLWGVYLVSGGSALGVCSGRGCLLPGMCVSAPRDVCVCSQGCVCLLRGVSTPGEGVYLVGGCQVLPPLNRITDACKNITLPQLCCGR